MRASTKLIGLPILAVLGIIMFLATSGAFWGAFVAVGQYLISGPMLCGRP